jgi:nucleotide-binding universal stress UspA family protein
VRVAHCVDPTRGAASDPGLSGYADAPHHEYPQRLHEMIDRAVAACTKQECACLAEVMLCRGEMEREIIQLVERHRVDVLVLGWHGSLASGHATRVKHLLAAVHCAVLFVKPPAGAHFLLRVGDALEGASPSSDAGR